MQNIVEKIDWAKSDLIPVIAQDYQTNRVLMLAYMDKEALTLTLKTKKAHYYSRSKKRIWMKGESSSNIQNIKEIYLV
jgi:phosphoribosyl-ATP pyrophosphohydrolase/phosphoribosyl-AMP cyclohydrolase